MSRFTKDRSGSHSWASLELGYSDGAVRRFRIFGALIFVLVSSCSHDARPSPLGRDEYSTPWTLLGQEGRTLTVEVRDGGCFSYDHLLVRESTTQVRITAVSIDLSEGDRNVACTLGIHSKIKTTQLNRPLGTRKLIAATLSPAWRQYELGDATPPP